MRIKLQERRKFYCFILISYALLWVMIYIFVKNYCVIKIFG